MSPEVLREIVEELERRATYWEHATHDPHRISLPMMVALREVAESIKTIEQQTRARETAMTVGPAEEKKPPEKFHYQK